MNKQSTEDFQVSETILYEALEDALYAFFKIHQTVQYKQQILTQTMDFT